MKSTIISTFHEYRRLAQRTRPPGDRVQKDRIRHWTIGLTGEAGEVANEIKKHVCTEKRSYDETRARVLDESGDVLWYLDAIADEYDITLQDIAEHNIAKLAARHAVNVAEKVAA